MYLLFFLLNDTTLDIFDEFEFKKMTDEEYGLLYDNTFYEELESSLNELKKRKLSSKDIMYLLASFNIVLNQIPDHIFNNLEIITSALADYYSKDEQRKQTVIEYSDELKTSLEELLDLKYE